MSSALRRLLLGAALVVLSLVAWTQAFPAPTAPTSADSVRIVRIFPEDAYRPMWEYAKICSGLKAPKDHPYEKIKWFYTPPHGMPHDMIGVWVPPDTIILDSLYLQAPWVVAHELLHHLLQPRLEDDKHPALPFLYPCMLSTPQNVPEGDWVVRPS